MLSYVLYIVYLNYVLVKLCFTHCLCRPTCIYFVSILYLPFLVNKDFQHYANDVCETCASHAGLLLSFIVVRAVQAAKLLTAVRQRVLA